MRRELVRFVMTIQLQNEYDHILHMLYRFWFENYKNTTKKLISGCLTLLWDFKRLHKPCIFYASHKTVYNGQLKTNDNKRFKPNIIVFKCILFPIISMVK